MLHFLHEFFHMNFSGSFETVNILVKIDFLSQVHRNAKVGSLFDVLSKSFLCGLRLVEENLLHQISSGIFQK